MSEISSIPLMCCKLWQCKTLKKNVMLTYSKTHNFENLKNNIFLFGALSLWQLIPFPLCYSIFTIYKMPPKLDAFSISILPPMLDTFELFTIDDDHITYTKRYRSVPYWMSIVTVNAARLPTLCATLRNHSTGTRL